MVEKLKEDTIVSGVASNLLQDVDSFRSVIYITASPLHKYLPKRNAQLYQRAMAEYGLAVENSRSVSVWLFAVGFSKKILYSRWTFT